MMNKLWSILLFSVVLFSCSGDDDKNLEPEEDQPRYHFVRDGLDVFFNAKESGDKRLEGKWKAFYTKCSHDVYYDFKKGKVTFNDEYKILEEEGENITTDYCFSKLKDGIFDYSEFNGEKVKYDTKGGYFVVTQGRYPSLADSFDYYKYKIEKEVLTIELIKRLSYSQGITRVSPYYAITQYKKIKE